MHLDEEVEPVSHKHLVVSRGHAVEPPEELFLLLGGRISEEEVSVGLGLGSGVCVREDGSKEGQESNAPLPPTCITRRERAEKDEDGLVRCLAGVEDLYLRGALREVERHAVHLSDIEACDQRIQAVAAQG
eukprot:scaffold11027_cov63-Phaeocystis_antarctica.AAC.4